MESLFKTGDLIRMEYWGPADQSEKQRHKGFEAHRKLINGVVQGFEYCNNDLCLRIFGAGDERGTRINYHNIISWTRLIFLPNPDNS